MEQKLTVSMYHYVRDLKHSRYPEIKGMDVHLFREQIYFMKEHFSIVRMEQVMDTVRNGTPLPENALLLGLRKNSAMTAFWKSLPFPVISSFTEWKKAAHPADLAAWRLWAQCCRLPDTLPFSEKIVTV